MTSFFPLSSDSFFRSKRVAFWNWWRVVAETGSKDRHQFDPTTKSTTQWHDNVSNIYRRQETKRRRSRKSGEPRSKPAFFSPLLALFRLRAHRVFKTSRYCSGGIACHDVLNLSLSSKRARPFLTIEARVSLENIIEWLLSAPTR